MIYIYLNLFYIRHNITVPNFIIVGYVLWLPPTCQQPQKGPSRTRLKQQYQTKPCHFRYLRHRVLKATVYWAVVLGNLQPLSIQIAKKKKKVSCAIPLVGLFLIFLLTKLNTDTNWAHIVISIVFVNLHNYNAYRLTTSATICISFIKSWVSKDFYQPIIGLYNQTGKFKACTNTSSVQPYQRISQIFR